MGIVCELHKVEGVETNEKVLEGTQQLADIKNKRNTSLSNSFQIHKLSENKLIPAVKKFVIQ